MDAIINIKLVTLKEITHLSIMNLSQKIPLFKLNQPNSNDNQPRAP